MNVDVVTLFPSAFLGALEDGMLARARRSGRFGVRVHDLRRFGVGPHRQVDDAPYGGGAGMVLKPEPLFTAVEWIRRTYPAEPDRVILLSPQGKRFDHRRARGLAGLPRVILLCGRYEGVDERVREGLADEEMSVADVVLTGGEIPATLVVDGIARFVPGVLGHPGAAEEDSFEGGRLEHPHWTRPAVYRGQTVPEVLLSGDHEAIARWRERRSALATRSKRPDLLQGAGHDEGE
ncbi:MAG TPA: tRNA (guanosine(37)-N1)-methyltransferase TrmD [Candidatus Polarisedimenticolaceae bacterium]|nr:tRNA (guanosine(37)-N1)-methyltransferase TrmD [Candidatus Polarisedimenticolaceae bacterium]